MIIERWIRPRYKSEIIASNSGHQILFLHQKLCPIELAWARVKNFSSENPTYKIKQIITNTLPFGFCLINENYAIKLFSHTDSILNYYELNSLEINYVLNKTK